MSHVYYVPILTIVIQNIKFLCVGSLPNIIYSLLLDRHCMFLLPMVPEEIRKYLGWCYLMSLCGNMSHTPIYGHQSYHVIIKCLIFTVNQ
jgi:hypothetical protein